MDCIFCCESYAQIPKGSFATETDARWAAFFEEFGIKYEYQPEHIRVVGNIYAVPNFRIYVRHRSYDHGYEPIYAVTTDELEYLYGDKGESLFLDALNERVRFIILDKLPTSDEKYREKADDCFHFSYSYIDGDAYPVYFSKYKGEAWLAGPDHEQYDFGEAFNDACKKAYERKIVSCYAFSQVQIMGKDETEAQQ